MERGDICVGGIYTGGCGVDSSRLFGVVGLAVLGRFVGAAVDSGMPLRRRLFARLGSYGCGSRTQLRRAERFTRIYLRLGVPGNSAQTFPGVLVIGRKGSLVPRLKLLFRRKTQNALHVTSGVNDPNDL